MELNQFVGRQGIFESCSNRQVIVNPANHHRSVKTIESHSLAHFNYKGLLNMR